MTCLREIEECWGPLHDAVGINWRSEIDGLRDGSIVELMHDVRVELEDMEQVLS
jgi:hypothetical protein